MARGPTVKVKGLSQLGRNVALLQKEIQEKELRKAPRAAANKVVKRAKAIVEAKGLVGDPPVHMRDAIRARRLSRVSKNGLEIVAVGVFKIGRSAKTGKKFTYAQSGENRRRNRVGKNYELDPPEFYWKFIELGTVNMSPKPFLVPAFEQEKNNSVNVMEESLEKGIKKATAKMKVIKP